MKYRVVVFERIVQRASKVFEASSMDEARALAEADTWSTNHGWSEWIEESFASESYIESIRPTNKET